MYRESTVMVVVSLNVFEFFFFLNLECTSLNLKQITSIIKAYFIYYTFYYAINVVLANDILHYVMMDYYFRYLKKYLTSFVFFPLYVLYVAHLFHSLSLCGTSIFILLPRCTTSLYTTSICNIFLFISMCSTPLFNLDMWYISHYSFIYM